MRTKVRVVAIQGVIELLHCISALYQNRQKADRENQEYEDYLVLHGTCMQGEFLESMAYIVSQMAKCWSWKAIINAECLADFRPGIDVRTLLGIEQADVILCGRNWQASNEILLASYEEAEVIIVPDACGLFDCIESEKHRRIDEIRTLLPIIRSNIQIDSIPRTIIPKQVFIEAIEQCVEKSDALSNYIDSIIRKYDGKSKVLIAMENFCESKLMNLQDMINMYASFMKKQHIDQGSLIFIKPHPRQNYEHVKSLKNLLNQCGFNHIVIFKEPFSVLPIEIYCRFLRFDKVFTFLSSSAISLAYLFEIHATIGIGEENYSKIKDEQFFRTYAIELQRIVNKLALWDGQSVLYSFQELYPLQYELIFGINIQYKQVVDKILNRIVKDYKWKKIILLGANNISNYMLKQPKLAKQVLFVADSYKKGYLNEKKICMTTALRDQKDYLLIINVVKQAREVNDFLIKEKIVDGCSEIIRFDHELETVLNSNT